MPEKNERQREEQEIGLYEKIAARTAEIVEEGKRSVEEAMKKAKEEMTAAGEFSREQIDKIGTYIRRDITLLGENSGKAKEMLKQKMDPERMTAGVQSTFSRLLSTAAGTLVEWAGKSENALEFKTGEVTSIGTLTCKECGTEMHMKLTVRIPPCPKCRKTVFRKSY